MILSGFYHDIILFLSKPEGRTTRTRRR